MKTTDDLENAMLFGVPVGALECETAPAALVRYGVDNIRWEIARRGYLELLEERNTK